MAGLAVAGGLLSGQTVAMEPNTSGTNTAGRPTGRAGDRAAWDERYRSAAVWKDGPNAALVAHAGQLVDRWAGSGIPQALDLACGQGGDAIWLAERGWDVVAVDWAGAALDRARSAAREHGVDVRFVEGDVTDGALLAELAPVGGFDLVTMSFLHPDPDKRVGHYSILPRLVAPGGHLLVIAHDPEHGSRGLPGPPPQRLLSPADIVDALALPDGFEVIVQTQFARATDAGETRDAVVLVRRGHDRPPTPPDPGR